MKTRSSLSTLLLLGATCALPGLAFAAGYKKAEITRLHKDVKVLKDNIAPRDAAIGDEITSVTSVATGAASRAELKFPDNSLTRLGANSRFTLRGDQRTLDLDQGVMLLQVPKQLGGAKVRTAAVTAAVTGTTVLFEYLPGGFVKLIVIEGVVDLYFNSDPSKFTNITAGQMIIMQVDSKQLPAPVDVDLSLLLKTSKLINGDDESMPNFMEVSQALQLQQKELQNGNLVATNFVLPGRGTLVELSNDTRLNLFKSFNVQDGSPSPGGPKPPGNNNNNGGNGNPNNDGPGFQGFVPLIDGTTFIGSGSFVETNPHVTAYNTETDEETRFEGRIYNADPAADEAYTFPFFGFGETDLVENPTFQPFLANASDSEPSIESRLWAVFKFEELVINSTPEFDFDTYYYGESEVPITNVIFAALNDVLLAPVVPEGSEEYFPEGSQLDLYYSDADKVVFYSQNGHVTVDQDFYINGDYQDFAFVAAGINSDVNLYGSIYTGGHILVSAGRDFYMDSNIYAGSMDAAAGRDINTTNESYSEGSGVEVENRMELRAKRSINITDSSQLRVMSCNSDAVMSLLAQGGNINLSDSTLEASNIEMTAVNGNGLNGDINILNSNLTAGNVLKAQTLGPDGRINIGGGSLSAGNIMKLYAEGANGGVYFTGNTTLTAGEIHIAGRTVQVNDTVAVTVPGTGTFNVYADQDKRNFNTEGFGSFSRMPTTKEFNDANRPAFNAPNVPSE